MDVLTNLENEFIEDSLGYCQYAIRFLERVRPLRLQPLEGYSLSFQLDQLQLMKKLATCIHTYLRCALYTECSTSRTRTEKRIKANMKIVEDF